MRELAARTVTVLLLLICAVGCGGGGTGPGLEAASQDTGMFSGVPLVPTGSADVRRATLVDSDIQVGTDSIDSAEAVPVGTSMLMQTVSLPAPTLSYTLFQFPERPGEDLHSVFVNGRYLDQTPNADNPQEGYWVAVSNYATGAWKWTGPFTTISTRVLVDNAVQPVSPGGFIYVLVAAFNGNDLYCDRAETCYYTTEGYDQQWLPLPQGEIAGALNDIQAGPDGEIAIAYLHGKRLMGETFMGAPRIASRVDGEWELEDIETLYSPSSIRFGIGSGGLRALLASDDEDLYLYWDDGSGTWAEHTLTTNKLPEQIPDLQFLNKNGTLGGPLNMAVVVYGEDVIGDDMHATYFTIDDTGATGGGDIQAADVYESQRMYLTTNTDGEVFLGLADKLAGWEMTLMKYNPVLDAWGVSPLAKFSAPDIEAGENGTPCFYYQPLVDPEHTAGYLHKSECYFRIGHYDTVSTSWLEPVSDNMFVYLPDFIDYERYGADKAVLACRTGNMQPALTTGTPGSGSSWNMLVLDDTPYSGMDISVATEGSNLRHAAGANAASGELYYYAVDASGEITRELVDSGGKGWGMCFGPVSVVEAAGRLHYFSADMSNMELRYSVNENGVWLYENRAIPASGATYVVMGGGYLEETGDLWCATLDYIDLAIYVTYGPPDGSNWQCVKFIQGVRSILFLEDNEREVAMLQISASPASDQVLVFTHGHPADGQPSEEYSLGAQSEHGRLLRIGYSHPDETWYAVGRSSDNLTGYCLARNPSGQWLGPYKICEYSNVNDYVIPVGITARLSDGQLQAVFWEEVDATDIGYANIYLSDDHGQTWSAPVTVESFDLTVTDVQGVTITPDDAGNAVVCIPAATGPTYDFTVYVTDDSSTWSDILVWNSPFESFAPEDMPCGLAWLGDNQVAIAGIEHRPNSKSGRMATYFPW